MQGHLIHRCAVPLPLKGKANEVSLSLENEVEGKRSAAFHLRGKGKATIASHFAPPCACRAYVHARDNK